MKSQIKKFQLTSLIPIFSDWGFSWGGLIDNRYGEWWFIGQGVLITCHIISPWPNLTEIGIEIPKGIYLIGNLIFLAGIILAAQALTSLGRSLSPLPEPKKGASLVTTGAYKSCRHPLYQAILISSLGLTISLCSILHSFLFFALCFLLKGKALREESKLKSIHPDYSSYMSNTPAIIPYLRILDWRV